MIDKLLTFERESAFNLIELLFKIGMIPLLFPAFLIGKYFAILFPTEIKVPADVPGHFTYTFGPNTLLGIVVGIAVLIVFILIWKAICQGSLIILEAFEGYTNNQNER